MRKADIQFGTFGPLGASLAEDLQRSDIPTATIMTPDFDLAPALHTTEFFFDHPEVPVVAVATLVGSTCFYLAFNPTQQSTCEFLDGCGQYSDMPMVLFDGKKFGKFDLKFGSRQQPSFDHALGATQHLDEMLCCDWSARCSNLGTLLPGKFAQTVHALRSIHDHRLVLMLPDAMHHGQTVQYFTALGRFL